MTPTPRRSHRARRAGAVVAVIGLAATVVAYAVARNDVDRLTRRNLDRSASTALLNVQSLTAAVDQVLSTANGVVAASDLDAGRFAEVLGPDVDASPTLSGMALVADGPGGARVVTTVGRTDLLGEHANVVRSAPATARLITWQRTDTGFALGFASKVARNAGAVYLQVELPLGQTAADRFAVARIDGGAPTVVLGNVDSVAGLRRWPTPVSIGGTELALFVAAGPARSGVLGIPLPTLVLVAGLLLTALGVVLAVALARRSAAVASLGDENRALDEALARARTVEAKLRASDDRFRSILRGAPDVIATIDPEHGSCVLLNRKELVDHPADQLRAPNGLLDVIEPDDRGGFDDYRRALATLEAERICEATLRVADPAGHEHHLRFRFSAIPRPGREPLLLGIISDVTEATEQAQREGQLQEALHRSQRLESVGQLASGVAHDFNNLLMVILGFSELLGSEDLTPEAGEYRVEIERAATRGSALVRQLLAFGNRDAAQPQLVDLDQLLETMEPMLRGSLGDAVQLQLVTAGGPCTIAADPVQMEQVVLNMALNARDAMPTGGILFIAVEAVGPDSPGDPERVVISVTDTGTGIDPSVRETLFDPFVTTKEPGKGTGLGLATVASIVDAMGGSISVYSAVEKGTTFEIALPFRDATPSPTIRAASPEPVDGRGQHVLVVEDEAAVRSALTKVLRHHHFDVVEAASAPDALHVLDAHPVDILVSDVVMPTMSGVQLAAHVRADHPDLPIVLMSGYSNELDGIGADAPFTALLRKPFTHGELLAVVHALLADRTADPIR